MSEEEKDPMPIQTPADGPTAIKVTSYFVRERNALLVRARFEDLYVDYYLHGMDHGLKYSNPYDQYLKEALAGMVLHATTRPWKETHAWTLNFQDPLFNLFVTGSSLAESVTGRVFLDGVKDTNQGLFHAQVKVPDEDVRNSAVPLVEAERGVPAAIEGFYEQSEQRLARMMETKDEEYVLISAQPDCDEEWLAGLTQADMLALDETETLSPLESRLFRFDCGCSLERIFPALAPLAAEGIDQLFAEEEAITVNCPRCAAKWRVTREQLEAVMGDEE
ncbi:MAG: Hsp33 family molecular chaperone HslO [Verrucomicrobiota bacterium]